MKLSLGIKPFMILLFLDLTLVACQSQPIKDFEKISLGQDKSDVVETIGGPSWKDRRLGMDRWTYIIYQDGIRLERQIQFLDGIVAYKGEPIQPFITAEEQDSINAERNLLADRLDSLKSSPASSSVGRGFEAGSSSSPINGAR